MNPFFSFIDNDFLMLTSKKTNLSFDDLLERIFKEFNLKNFDLVRLQQTHSNNIICTNVPGLYNDSDGIIIHEANNLIPVIATADCVPLFIYDSAKNIYGLIHCGWRGIFLKIHLKALDLFIKKGSNIKDIKIYGHKNSSGPVISFNIKGIQPYDLSQLLAQQNIFIRAGHHCAQPTMDRLNIQSSNRLSLYIYNDFEDIDRLIKGIKKSIQLLSD